MKDKPWDRCRTSDLIPAFSISACGLFSSSGLSPAIEVMVQSYVCQCVCQLEVICPRRNAMREAWADIDESVSLDHETSQKITAWQSAADQTGRSIGFSVWRVMGVDARNRPPRAKCRSLLVVIPIHCASKALCLVGLSAWVAFSQSCCLIPQTGTQLAGQSLCGQR